MAKSTSYNRSSSGRFRSLTVEERYDQYVEEHNAMESELRSMGRTPHVDLMSMNEFKAHYVGAKNQAEESGQDLKLDLKYIRDVVDAEKYKMTKAQAKGLQKVIQRETRDSDRPFGKRVTYEEIRSGEFKDEEYDYREIAYERLSQEYRELKAKGNSGKAAREEIARRYFGSP